MPHFFIKHITEYEYSDTIYESAFKVMLYPIIDKSIAVIKHEIQVSFNPSIDTRKDINNNSVGTFSIVAPHKYLAIESFLEVKTFAKAVPVFQDDAIIAWNQLNEIQDNLDFIYFLQPEASEINFELIKIIERFTVQECHPQELAIKLSEFVYQHLTYQKGVTTTTSTLKDVWSLKAGVCQDFTNILLQLLRLAKIPARYVSGYLCGTGNDFFGLGATHAWVEVYIPKFGWLGLDPTNNCFVNENHVKIATGKNYNDCAPVLGTYRGDASNTLKVTVEVSNDAIKKETPLFGSKSTTYFKQNSFALHQQYMQEQQQQ